MMIVKVECGIVGSAMQGMSIFGTNMFWSSSDRDVIRHEAVGSSL